MPHDVKSAFLRDTRHDGKSAFDDVRSDMLKRLIGDNSNSNSDSDSSSSSSSNSNSSSITIIISSSSNTSSSTNTKR